MTLNTEVHLVGAITAELAFDLALRAILTAADEMDRFQGAIVDRSHADAVPIHVGSRIGQGLPGITDAEAYPDGRLFEVDTYDGEPYGDLTPWNARISWDTGYAFSTAAAPSASHLHAVALTCLHGTLPEGVSMRWCNEFTGEWHDGLDGLAEFSESGFAAAAFARSVVAAITEA